MSPVLLFLECHIIEIIQHVAFSDWLLHLAISIHGLIAYFFVVLNNSPLFGCNTIYLYIHLQKDSLVASKPWQLWINGITPVCRFLCGHKFLTPLSKYQRVWFLDLMVKSMFSFIRNLSSKVVLENWTDTYQKKKLYHSYTIFKIYSKWVKS